MNLQQAVKSCLKSYARGRGRASRSEYWWFQLAAALFYAAGWLVVAGLFTLSERLGSSLVEIVAFVLGIVFVLALVALIIPSITVLVRRLHDSGKSAHYLWFGLIPFVGGIILLVFTLLESDRGPNAYGPEPGAPRGLVESTASAW